jgi:predicted RNase H-like HicB family nuclease
MENFQFTAIIEEGENGWFVGQVEEVPEAISQGKTVEELLENLTDAVKLVLQAKRESVVKQFKGRKTIKRKLEIA